MVSIYRTGKSDEERYQILQPTLELNPKHAIIRKLHDLKSSNPELAKLVADQVKDLIKYIL